MKSLILIALLFSITISCNKPEQETPVEPAMPPKTDTGANMLAFKMNGKVHFYDRKSTYLNADGIYLQTNYKYLNQELVMIRAHRKMYSDDLEMRINTWKIELNKEYIFSTETGEAFAEYYIETSNNTHHTKEGSGSIIFRRFDSLVVAGEFHFTAFLNNSQIQITEGFFDIAAKN